MRVNIDATSVVQDLYNLDIDFYKEIQTSNSVYLYFEFTKKSKTTCEELKSSYLSSYSNVSFYKGHCEYAPELKHNCIIKVMQDGELMGICAECGEYRELNQDYVCEQCYYEVENKGG